MKAHRVIFVPALFAIGVLIAGALGVVAQQTTDRAPRTANVQAGTADTNRGLGKLDTKTSGANIRASQLIGANLKNSSDESVGEIKDLVLDANTGKVRYAAVTYGGFLGLGSKLFAVPFEAFRVRQNTNSASSGDYTLTLDVTKEQLKGAQGFNNDHWPDFADTTFTQELDRRYKVDRSQIRQ